MGPGAAQARGGVARRAAGGFRRGSGRPRAEKGAGPAGPSLHAEPLTSLRAGDPAPASEAPPGPRHPGPPPGTQTKAEHRGAGTPLCQETRSLSPIGHGDSWLPAQ